MQRTRRASKHGRSRAHYERAHELPAYRDEWAKMEEREGLLARQRRALESLLAEQTADQLAMLERRKEARHEMLRQHAKQRRAAKPKQPAGFDVDESRFNAQSPTPHTPGRTGRTRRPALQQLDATSPTGRRQPAPIAESRRGSPSNKPSDRRSRRPS